MRFLGTWLLTCLVFVMLATVFSAVVDPYSLLAIPRIDGFNARKPAVHTQIRLMKAYDVLRAAPAAVVLGSSRVEIGVDTRNSQPLLNSRPVYNLGLGGAGPYVAYRYLQHVSSRRSPDLVMLGLDFEYFLKLAEVEGTAEPEEFEAYLAITRHGKGNADRRWRHTVSLDALSDSAVTLITNIRDAPAWDLAVAGNHDFEFVRNYFARTGSSQYFRWIDIVALRYYIDTKLRRDPLVMKDVEAILTLCESQGTSVVLFINPLHADMLEMFDLAGLWPAFEDWKRDLVKLAATRATTDGASGIPLWDFSGYHSYATESVPTEGLLRWFWDPSHFRPELGDLMLRRMLGADEPFGVLLTPAVLEPHLAAIREQRQLYRKHATNDVRRLRDLYDAVLSGAR